MHVWFTCLCLFYVPMLGLLIDVWYTYPYLACLSMFGFYFMCVFSLGIRANLLICVWFRYPCLIYVPMFDLHVVVLCLSMFDLHTHV